MDKRLLALDIEWAPTKAYIWEAFKENIGADQIIDHGHMLCFCATWVGSGEYQFFSEWDDGREGMAKAALSLLTEAEAVITYNGDRYDLPKLRGEILLAGLTPPPVVTSIDCIRTVKGLGFMMNRLAYIGPLLGVGNKTKHHGFGLWKDVLDGKPSAYKLMTKYCIQDVKMLVKLYHKIKPFIKQHPHLGSSTHECGACGSNKIQKRGTRRTKFFKIQRIQCQSCGSWSEGKREKIA